jgi:hypothetical protein
MTLQAGLPVLGGVPAKDVPRQQHAHGLPADEARSDESVLDLDEVLQGEIIPCQRQDSALPADNDSGQLFHHFLLFPGGLGGVVQKELLGLQEDPVPVVELALRADRAPRAR